jgi:hypothetical protein
MKYFLRNFNAEIFSSCIFAMFSCSRLVIQDKLFLSQDLSNVRAAAVNRWIIYKLLFCNLQFSPLSFFHSALHYFFCFFYMYLKTVEFYFLLLL